MEKSVQKFHIPYWEELPEIDLYLDQVVNFIDKYLHNYSHSNIDANKDDKILTKTMINNYVKQKIINPPEKKKYNKEHIALLIVITILKQVYSINDIDKLIKLALENSQIDKAYNTFCEALENAVKLTFSNKIVIENIDPTSKKYILCNVVQTFASKLYVENKYLENEKNMA